MYCTFIISGSIYKIIRGQVANMKKLLTFPDGSTFYTEGNVSVQLNGQDAQEKRVDEDVDLDKFLSDDKYIKGLAKRCKIITKK